MDSNAEMLLLATPTYYVVDSCLRFDEDATHEFKGHKNLSEEELPPWVYIESDRKRNRRTRGPISSCLNGFLNSGRGGTAYMGILDDGKVIGLAMTQFQKDHFTLALDDLMQRYTPPVEKHRYQLRFVPVVDKQTSMEEIKRIVNYDTSQNADISRRRTAHCLRDHRYCWCDLDRQALYRCGVVAALYVIEIVIKPWDADDVQNKYAVGDMKASPMHEDEVGIVRMRRQATVVPCSVQDIVSLSRQCVQNHYRHKIDRLRNEVHSLRRDIYNECNVSDTVHSN